jgi:hypothetical protein
MRVEAAAAAAAQLLQRFEGEKRIQSDCLLATAAGSFCSHPSLQVFLAFEMFLMLTMMLTISQF